MTVAECLRRFQTGALRRTPDDRPFEDAIRSERTPRCERAIANHPSLKPQAFLRQIVHASLPLGEGVVVDPFMGGGSTIAAAEAVRKAREEGETVADWLSFTLHDFRRTARLPCSFLILYAPVTRGAKRPG